MKGRGKMWWTGFAMSAVVVLFLMWVYVSSVILMYGVEFTAAHYRARRHPPATAASV